MTVCQVGWGLELSVFWAGFWLGLAWLGQAGLGWVVGIVMLVLVCVGVVLGDEWSGSR